ncbi:MAG: hypothetical protein LJE91_10500 [Gammaproteobacteria bacterium]|nr:hypothetical protein [Gammaproteobacteria bacterium]
MKKRAKILLEKSLDSLILAIEHFNRPWDRGRSEAVLILLDRALELLPKAIILHKGGKIREAYEKETVGHEKCVRKCITDEKVKCLSEEQGLTIQIINSFRDAAQHDIVELSEQELYMYCQAGVSLYKDLISSVFGESLKDYVPERVLPVSTEPPRDLHTMVEADFEEIRNLLKPKSRRQLEAKSKLRALAIVEASLEGVRSQPSEFELRKMVKEVRANKKWQEIFPGVASLQLNTEGTGINVDIRIKKKEGEAVQLVPEGTPGATVLAVKRVNELDYYTLGASALAKKTGLTQPKLVALVWHLKLQASEEYYKAVKIGKSVFKRYSAKALNAVKNALETANMDEIWRAYKKREK